MKTNILKIRTSAERNFYNNIKMNLGNVLNLKTAKQIQSEASKQNSVLLSVLIQAFKCVYRPKTDLTT